MDLNLKNKKALVCGASQGIGEAICKELAELGADIILVARTESRLFEVVKNLPAGNHRVLALDLLDRHNLSQKLDEVLLSGPIEILINNSGGPKAGPLLMATEEDFLNGFQNHILAASLIVQKLIPGMQKNKYGRIINIISTSVKAPIGNLGVSNTIRGAMANWAKTLANEVASLGITVNNILPGYTETPRLEALAQAQATRQNKSIDDIKQQWKSVTPAGRFASAQEVAQAVAFLASPSAGFINGVNLPVDGGRTPCL